MASLQSIRDRLARLQQHNVSNAATSNNSPVSDNDNTDQGNTGNATGSTLINPSTVLQCRLDDTSQRLSGARNILEEKENLDRIEARGNQAEEWLSFIIHLSTNIPFSTKDVRYCTLVSYFDKAFKSVSTESMKREAYACLLVNYALLQATEDEERGQRAFSVARNNGRRFAMVHIIAAQHEMSLGNTQKAKQVLLKASDRGAEPKEKMNQAFSNLVSGTTNLVPEQDINDWLQGSCLNNKENKMCTIALWGEEPASSPMLLSQEPLAISKSGLIQKASQTSRAHGGMKGSMRMISSSSEDSSMDCSLGHSASYGRVLKSSHNGTGKSYTASTFVMERKHSDSDGVHTSSHSYDDQSAPVHLPDHGDTDPPDAASHKLRSFHSTPDCKSMGVLSTITVRNKRLVGKPMRVLKRTGLPELLEGGCNEESHDNSLCVAPLPPDTTMESVDATASPPAFSEQHHPTINSPEPMDVHQSSGISTSTNQQQLQSVLSSDIMACSAPIPPINSGRSILEPKPNGRIPNPHLPPPQSVALAQPNTVKHPATPSHQLQPTTDTPQLPSSQPAPKSQPLPPKISIQKPKLQTNQPDVQQPKPTIAPVIAPQPVPPCVQPQLQAPAPGAPTCTPMGKNVKMLTINGKTYFSTRVIGRGGFSKVYEALSCDDSSLRAIKCVNLEGGDEATIQSYMNEILLLRKLQYSDSIIKMFDFEYHEDEGVVYVVMERGDTDLMSLFKRSQKAGSMHPLKIKFYWLEMLRAVQVLHKEDIVHSDLKPANFLLVAGSLKLIDFGIANAIQKDQTSVTLDQQLGTLNYMSPEAIMDVGNGTELDENGQQKPRIKIGVKSDVWSLGCILYTMVYGKTPFQHITNQLKKLQAIINPSHVIQFADLPDPQLLSTLKKCLRRDPKSRPSIEELLQDTYLQNL